MLAPSSTVREIRHFHLFAGLGGGAAGFNRANVRVGSMEGRFRCIGGVDVDAAAVRDFSRLAGVPGTVLDLFDREQYVAFHGQEPPAGWKPAGPDAIRRAAGGERPHIVFLSPPCKGFSGLLAESRSTSERYQALNRLTVRGVWLMLEAWADDPPELVILENVPRIAARGRKLLDSIVKLLRAYGYLTAETTHDCGEVGGLAQSRKRFLLVARHAAKVPPFLYEPPRRPLRAVGTVLERMLLPGDDRAGPMHRVPSLQWRTWVRLAFVEAGSDWRCLNKLRVVDGHLTDFALVPDRPYFNGAMGVLRWEAPAGTVAGESLPLNGAFSVADPRRPEGRGEYGQFGVRRWEDTSGAVSGQSLVGGGAWAVADPRHDGPPKHSNVFRIVPWSEEARCVTGAHGSGQCVADPRPAEGRHPSKYRVTRWQEPGGTVIGASATGDGAFAVADPRPGLDREKGDAYLTGGHYGVLRWQDTAGAVAGAGQHDNGRWSVADPRPVLPAAEDRLVAVIRAMDGTWHRPFTTLELAALQGLVCPEALLELDGLSDTAWRERIGNAVPPPAAQAIAETMGRTLLLAWSGEGFALSALPIWVQPMVAALQVARGEG